MVGVDRRAAVGALTVEGGASLTAEAWEARSHAVARGLVARGIGPGSRVGLLFDGRRWADFAVAWLGVRKAGAVAVHFSPGAAPADLARAVAHAEISVLLRPEADEMSGAWSTEPRPAAEPAGDIVYPPAPLAPPGPVAFGGDDVVAAPAGWFVHAWAPGTIGGRHALRLLAGGGRVATLGVFDPGGFCTLVEERGAAGCGLTPALAAAVVAPGAAANHDLSSVREVVLAGSPSARLRARLEEAFAGAAVTVIDSGTRPPPPGAAPVAVSQEGMLWHEQFTPGSFNLPCLVRRYRGPLDVPALQWALAELVRRHQPLRTTFAVVGGEPVQVVGTGAPVEVDDLTAMAPEARDARAAELLADASRRPFDLVTGPLFEPRIVRLGPDDHLLVARLHHTVFDDWSVDLLRRELSALYTAGHDGTPSPLVEPATTFGEVCRRRRAALAGERDEAERSWWRGELAGAPLAVQVPIAAGGPGEPVRLDLPPALAAGLRALAPTVRATPFMTVLAAFSVLLSRMTGQDDLVIATVVAHRDASDVEPLIGCFTKKVPLRLRLEGDPTFPELVARARTSLLAALSHQDLAFDAAVQEGLGGPAAEHGVVPQMAVVFQGETPQTARLRMPGLSIGPYEVPARAREERHFSAGPDPWGDGIYSGTFLILSLLETADAGLALIARGVFDRPAARRLLEDFRDLLAGVVAEPDRRISAFGGVREVRPAAPDDVVELRGFRFSRSRVEAALGEAPGVARVTVAVHDGRLRASVVVVDGDRPPSLVDLRRALWARLPGAPWPVEAVVVDALGREEPLEPGVGDDPMTAMWAEISGRPVGPRDSYWQDFSFLQALAEAREAGLALDDEQVVRGRTLEMLAIAPSPPAR